MAKYVQQKLFPANKTRKRTPGEKSFDEFVAGPDVKFHGTFHPGWEDNPVVHYGTKGQATDRLTTVGQHMKRSGFRADYLAGGDAPDDGFDPEVIDQPLTGRVFARKLPKAAPNVVSDFVANRADYAHRLNQGAEEWEVPKSIRESSGFSSDSHLVDPEERLEDLKGNTQVRRAMTALGEGKSVAYENDIEGYNPYDVYENRAKGVRAPDQPVSHVARPETTTSWEREQLSDPNASPARKAFAQQRIDTGQEGAVPFFQVSGGKRDYQHPLPGFDVVEGTVPVGKAMRSVSQIQFKGGK